MSRCQGEREGRKKRAIAALNTLPPDERNRFRASFDGGMPVLEAIDAISLPLPSDDNKRQLEQTREKKLKWTLKAAGKSLLTEILTGEPQPVVTKAMKYRIRKAARRRAGDGDAGDRDHDESMEASEEGNPAAVLQQQENQQQQQQQQDARGLKRGREEEVDRDEGGWGMAASSGHGDDGKRWKQEGQGRQDGIVS
ncbi:unnamed protein product [Vitrella brassicaformis CCMP3155]|uniref:Uncharacterized protein n=2 Tax=Vitrella brassicaformis TaxID=1169539 RepID=A0A0G4GLD6_VITBC|nr:unnamed protein product [Vitrella brassicaformis CCMP3155]|eukprot:CEM30945.1 unnamed protein product [Vitrella brassicaformis CCMP3155]